MKSMRYPKKTTSDTSSVFVCVLYFSSHTVGLSPNPVVPSWLVLLIYTPVWWELRNSLLVVHGWNCMVRLCCYSTIALLKWNIRFALTVSEPLFRVIAVSLFFSEPLFWVCFEPLLSNSFKLERLNLHEAYYLSSKTQVFLRISVWLLNTLWNFRSKVLEKLSIFISSN